MLSKYQKEISAAIKQARVDRRLTQGELAAKLGLSQSRLSEIESGKGSITAEQLIVLLQFFNLPISYFVKTKKVDIDTQLQNALARFGASHLKEDPDVLPSNTVEDITDLIYKVLYDAPSVRLVVGLLPLIVENSDKINWARIERKFIEMGRHRRFCWFVDGCRLTLIKRPRHLVGRERYMKYAKAIFHLNEMAMMHRPCGLDEEETHAIDVLDHNIHTKKSMNIVSRKRDDLAQKWNIVTRITEEDFYKALIEAEHD